MAFFWMHMLHYHVQNAHIHSKDDEQLVLLVIIIPLFALGSIYSTNVSGAEQMRETNNSNQT